MNYIYWYQQKIQYYIHEGYLRAKALAHLCGPLSRADPEAARTRDRSDPINPRGELARLAFAQDENRAYLTRFSSVRGRV